MRFILGIVAAAILMFFWGFFCWAVLPLRLGILKNLPQEDAILQAVAANQLKTGIYVYPYPAPETGNLPAEDAKKVQEVMDAKARKGPILQLMVRGEGHPSMDPQIFVQGFLHMLLSAGLVATLIRCVCSCYSFAFRWGVVIAFGICAAVWIDLSNAIWSSFPWDYQLFVAAYDVGAWVLAGLPIAWATRGDGVNGTTA